MQTGTRWGGKANPRDLTKTRQLELLRQKADREQAASIDVQAVRQDARRAGYQQGFEEGAAWAFEQLANAGVDVDAVLALDEPGDEDEAGE
jgi:hypothetical protein